MAGFNVSVDGQQGVSGPVLFRVVHQAHPAGVSRRFTEFETLHAALQQTDESGLSGLALPEKHLLGLGLWRDRDTTLRERAAHLEAYLNAALHSGSKEAAVLLASFAELDVISLTPALLQAEPASVAAETVAEPLPSATPLTVRSVLSCAVCFLLASGWILMLAVWMLLSDAAALSVRHARSLGTSIGGRAAAAKASASIEINSRFERLPRLAPHLSSMPKPVPRLAELLAACLRGQISFSAMLTGAASTIFLHPPVVALVRRLPEEPRLRCARALQAVCPQLVLACSGGVAHSGGFAHSGAEAEVQGAEEQGAEGAGEQGPGVERVDLSTQGVVSLDEVKLSSSSGAGASPTASSASSEENDTVVGSASSSAAFSDSAFSASAFSASAFSASAFSASSMALGTLDGAASEATPTATPRSTASQPAVPPPMRA